MVFVIADERYEQEYRARDGSSVRVERRSLLSEIVFVRTPEEEQRAGYPWVQFRDVVEVDGAPLPDHRGRLERLFSEASGSAYAQASAMIGESARYNLGPHVRTVNVPCFALFFLHPRNQSRFKFELRPAGQAGRLGQVGFGGREESAGQLANVTSLPRTAYQRHPSSLPHLRYPPLQPGVVVLRYQERSDPTMIRSPKHEDLPSSGFFWVEQATGRVLKSRMDVKVDRRWTTTIEVTYGHDAGTDAWVPQTMHERAGRPVTSTAGGQDLSFADDEILDCTATYSNFRRFRTDARIIR